MNKYLLRCVAVLVIPSLVSDPGPAIVFSHHPLSLSVFNDQALTSPLVGAFDGCPEAIRLRQTAPMMMTPAGTGTSLSLKPYNLLIHTAREFVAEAPTHENTVFIFIEQAVGRFTGALDVLPEALRPDQTPAAAIPQVYIDLFDAITTFVDESEDLSKYSAPDAFEMLKEYADEINEILKRLTPPLSQVIKPSLSLMRHDTLAGEAFEDRVVELYQAPAETVVMGMVEELDHELQQILQDHVPAQENLLNPVMRLIWAAFRRTPGSPTSALPTAEAFFEFFKLTQKEALSSLKEDVINAHPKVLNAEFLTELRGGLRLPAEEIRRRLWRDPDDLDIAFLETGYDLLVKETVIAFWDLWLQGPEGLSEWTQNAIEEATLKIARSWHGLYDFKVVSTGGVPLMMPVAEDLHAAALKILTSYEREETSDSSMIAQALYEYVIAKPNVLRCKEAGGDWEALARENDRLLQVLRHHPERRMRHLYQQIEDVYVKRCEQWIDLYVAPRARTIDAIDVVPLDLFQKLMREGVVSTQFKQADGGVGLSTDAWLRVNKKMAQVSSGVTLGAMNVLSSLGADPLEAPLANPRADAQRQDVQRKLLHGEAIVDFCLTEPGAGSDNLHMKAHVDAAGMLTGDKIFITVGSVLPADYMEINALPGRIDRIDQIPASLRAHRPEFGEDARLWNALREQVAMNVELYRPMEHWHVVAAWTDHTKHALQGISSLMVPMKESGELPRVVGQQLVFKPRTGGVIKATKQRGVLGNRGSGTTQFEFAQVPVDLERDRLGDLSLIFETLSKGRFVIAAHSLGLLWGLRIVLTAAISQREREEETRTSRVTEIIAMANILCQNLLSLETVYSQWLTAGARKKDEGRDIRLPASLAKLLMSTAATEMTQPVLTMLASLGYQFATRVSGPRAPLDQPGDYVEMRARDSRLLTIGEGTSEVQQNIVTKSLLKDKNPPMYADELAELRAARHEEPLARSIGQLVYLRNDALRAYRKHQQAVLADSWKGTDVDGTPILRHVSVAEAAVSELSELEGRIQALLAAYQAMCSKRVDNSLQRALSHNLADTLRVLELHGFRQLPAAESLQLQTRLHEIRLQSMEVQSFDEKPAEDLLDRTNPLLADALIWSGYPRQSSPDGSVIYRVPVEVGQVFDPEYHRFENDASVVVIVNPDRNELHFIGAQSGEGGRARTEDRAEKEVDAIKAYYRPWHENLMQLGAIVFGAGAIGNWMDHYPAPGGSVWLTLRRVSGHLRMMTTDLGPAAVLGRFLALIPGESRWVKGLRSVIGGVFNVGLIAYTQSWGWGVAVLVGIWLIFVAGTHVLAAQFILPGSVHTKVGLEQIAQAVESTEAEGAHAILALSGEAAQSEEEADAMVKSYIAFAAYAKERWGDSGLRRHVAVKLSMFWKDFDGSNDRHVQEVSDRVTKIAIAFKEAGLYMEIDGEYSENREAQIKIAHQVQKNLHGWDGIGIAIQAYFADALDVIDKEIERSRDTGWRIGIRLVKGAYYKRERKLMRSGKLKMESGVLVSQAEVDRNYRRVTTKLLESARHVYPMIASMNPREQTWAQTEALRLGLNKNQWAQHMLYGMMRHYRDRLLKQGAHVGTYLVIGEKIGGVRYFGRRVDEITGRRAISRLVYSRWAPAWKVAGYDEPAETLLQTAAMMDGGQAAQEAQTALEELAAAETAHTRRLAKDKLDRALTKTAPQEEQEHFKDILDALMTALQANAFPGWTAFLESAAFAESEKKWVEKHRQGKVFDLKKLVFVSFVEALHKAPLVNAHRYIILSMYVSLMVDQGKLTIEEVADRANEWGISAHARWNDRNKELHDGSRLLADGSGYETSNFIAGMMNRGHALDLYQLYLRLDEREEKERLLAREIAAARDENREYPELLEQLRKTQSIASELRKEIYTKRLALESKPQSKEVPKEPRSQFLYSAPPPRTWRSNGRNITSLGISNLFGWVVSTRSDWNGLPKVVSGGVLPQAVPYFTSIKRDTGEQADALGFVKATIETQSQRSREIYLYAPHDPNLHKINPVPGYGERTVFLGVSRNWRTHYFLTALGEILGIENTFNPLQSSARQKIAERLPVWIENSRLWRTLRRLFTLPQIIAGIGGELKIHHAILDWLYKDGFDHDEAIALVRAGLILETRSLVGKEVEAIDQSYDAIMHRIADQRMNDVRLQLEVQGRWNNNTITDHGRLITQGA